MIIMKKKNSKKNPAAHIITSNSNSRRLGEDAAKYTWNEKDLCFSCHYLYKVKISMIRKFHTKKNETQK